MRNFALCLLIAMPTIGFSQTVKINAGIAPGVILRPGFVSSSTSNAEIGFSGLVGLDFAETKKGFLSAGLGILQKGRKDEITLTDAQGRTRGSRTLKEMHTYGTASFTANFKLINHGVIPFVSVGPRVDFLISGKDKGYYENVLFGASAHNKRFGKKLADGTQHQLLFRYCAAVISLTL